MWVFGKEKRRRERNKIDRIAISAVYGAVLSLHAIVRTTSAFLYLGDEVQKANLAEFGPPTSVATLLLPVHSWPHAVILIDF